MNCYADSFKPKSRKLCRVFASGCGARIVQDAKLPNPGPAFFYGVTQRQMGLFHRVLESGDDWYYCDNGYAPGRVFRITRNAAQIDGTGKGDHKRRRALMPPVQPWKTDGKTVLVCLQSEFHHALWGEPRADWLKRTLATLKANTDRPVIVRDKPLRNPETVPLETALEDAWAVVTWNSRVAVEAILAGVPAFVSVACAASPMAGDDLTEIETPPRPDGREEWAAVLANNQWTLGEIKTGFAWTQLRDR